jgi:hypothetical protein
MDVMTAVITAQGENMTSITEETATAQATAAGEPQKGTKKANAAKRSHHVAPGKAKSKKSPAKPKQRARARQGPKEARTNKKAEVVAMMKRTKGATLAEIMEATGGQKHTVRGLVSILGSKGGEKIESSKNAAGERTYRIAK